MYTEGAPAIHCMVTSDMHFKRNKKLYAFMISRRHGLSDNQTLQKVRDHRW